MNGIFTMKGSEGKQKIGVSLHVTKEIAELFNYLCFIISVFDPLGSFLPNKQL